MTYKVMLVDDEMLVRLGVKSLIQWEEHGFQFMGDAPDGAKALELMEDGPPDILLTDIVMPNMNGLELIEKVKERYPSTLIIVLSSHNEFDYVRKAMKMGVEDYLLKTSLKPAELLHLLIEAKGKLQRNHEKRSEQQKLGEAPVETPDSMNRLLESALSNEWTGNDWAERDNALPDHSYLLLLHVRGIREGVPHLSAAGLLKHLVEAELQGMVHAGPIQTDEREIAAMLKLPDGDRDKLKARIDNLANASGSLLGISLNGYTSGPVGRWSETGERLAELQGMVHAAKAKEASRDDIKKLLRYMDEHYAKNLSLRSAAGMVNMSEAYLSTIFKKETGTNFTDWLNMLRIEKAATLLIETDLPSYLISEQVGYENSNYFGRLFKKMKGVSPQKYRAIYGNNNHPVERM
ncbi:response regulator [Paenibacillus sp. LHD-117]|uniref:response regulator transcription factor n=1 Tax=Paenibacillus sp. LHD-117 TaxID=3071412 RepID=UPI0027DFCE7C|nr:response regulator [Paenibacillus sp. LHD-117]MDQ6423496.1 response regulator [Paenibacillus sp. LHD-117]